MSNDSLELEDNDADFLRDLALKLEKEDFEKAKRLMELALIARPLGPFIQKKVDEYNEKEVSVGALKVASIAKKTNKVFFQHIAKAGGTSINKLLSDHFGQSNSKEHIESINIGEKSSDLNHLDFISGHRRYYHVDKVLDLSKRFSFSMIRHPLDHLISHLKWVYKISENQNSSFFNNHPDTIKELSLYMRSINWNDFLQVKKFFKYEHKGGKNLFNNCQTRYFLSNQFGELGEDDFREAKLRMDRFNLIGKLEFQDDFVLQLSELTGIRFQQLETLNTNRIDSFIDVNNSNIKNLLLEQIQFDIRLYCSFDKYFLGNNVPAVFQSA